MPYTNISQYEDWGDRTPSPRDSDAAALLALDDRSIGHQSVPSRKVPTTAGLETKLLLSFVLYVFHATLKAILSGTHT